MRKAIVIFLVMFAGVGCDDSVQDVTSDALPIDDALPDTVIVENDVTVELYGPSHARAIERGSELFGRSELRSTAEAGSVLLFEEVFVTHAIVEDGRDAEVTLIPLVSSSGEDLGGIIVIRRGDEELITSLPSEARADDVFAEEEIANKRPGPQALDERCLAWARSNYNACVFNCVKNPNANPLGCKITCFLHAVVSYIGCLYLATYA